MKKWITISIIVVVTLIIAWLFFMEFTCRNTQRRCTMYDLTTIENEEDIDFYRSLNDKCAGKCWIKKVKLSIDKWWCRQQYKQYKERTKDRRYFKADIYNPCPEFYTLKELNSFLK